MRFSMERDFDHFVVFDLETTGFGAAAGITEIGAVKVEHGEFIARFSSLVNPGCHIPYPVQLLNGITDELVADAPRFPLCCPVFLPSSATIPSSPTMRPLTVPSFIGKRKSSASAY